MPAMSGLRLRNGYGGSGNRCSSRPSFTSWMEGWKDSASKYWRGMRRATVKMEAERVGCLFVLLCLARSNCELSHRPTCVFLEFTTTSNNAYVRGLYYVIRLRRWQANLCSTLKGDNWVDASITQLIIPAQPNIFLLTLLAFYSECLQIKPRGDTCIYLAKPVRLITGDKCAQNIGPEAAANIFTGHISRHLSRDLNRRGLCWSHKLCIMF